MEALNARHTVCVIEMIGFGGSVSDAREIAIATQAAAVLAWLDAESVPLADLIGNSVSGSTIRPPSTRQSRAFLTMSAVALRP